MIKAQFNLLNSSMGNINFSESSVGAGFTRPRGKPQDSDIANLGGIGQGSPAPTALHALGVMKLLVQNNSDTFAKLETELKSEKSLSEAFANLTQTEQDKIEAKIGNGYLAELLSMSEESDESISFENFLHFGIELKTQRDYDQATVVLGALAQAPNMPQVFGEVPESFRSRALKQYQALVGEGEVGRRVEVLTNRFQRDSFDLHMIAPMIGASALGEIVGAAYVGKFLGAGKWFSRTWIAKVGAGLMGYAAEAPAFALLNRAVTPNSEVPFVDDLERAGLMIGALKFCGFAGKYVAKGLSQTSQFISQQLATFLGMSISHKIEELTHLRNAVAGETFVIDTISSMITMGVGNHLGVMALGERYQKFQSDLQMHMETVGANLVFAQHTTNSVRQWDLESTSGLGAEWANTRFATPEAGEPSLSPFTRDLIFASLQVFGIMGAYPVRGSNRRVLQAPIKILEGIQFSKKLTEAEVDAILQAILDHDKEFYPEGDGRRISGFQERFHYRRYFVGDREITLAKLADAVRQARGIRMIERYMLPTSEIIKEWQAKFSKPEWDELFADKRIVKRLPGLGKLKLGTSPSESAIELVLRKIASVETYIQFSCHEAVFGDRWYQVGGQEVSLKTLAYFTRRARGLKINDFKSLPNGEIVRQWNQKIFGLEPQERDRTVFPLEIDFEIPKTPTEENILQLVRVIIAQDKESYPEGNVETLTGRKSIFQDRWYFHEGKLFNLATLVGWTRIARGLKAKDYVILPNSRIMAEWRAKLGGGGISPTLIGMGIGLSYLFSSDIANAMVPGLESSHSSNSILWLNTALTTGLLAMATSKKYLGPPRKLSQIREELRVKKHLSSADAKKTIIEISSPASEGSVVERFQAMIELGSRIEFEDFPELFMGLEKLASRKNEIGNAILMAEAIGFMAFHPRIQHEEHFLWMLHQLKKSGQAFHEARMWKLDVSDPLTHIVEHPHFRGRDNMAAAVASLPYTIRERAVGVNTLHILQYLLINPDFDLSQHIRTIAQTIRTSIRNPIFRLCFWRELLTHPNFNGEANFLYAVKEILAESSDNSRRILEEERSNVHRLIIDNLGAIGGNSKFTNPGWIVNQIGLCEGTPEDKAKAYVQCAKNPHLKTIEDYKMIIQGILTLEDNPSELEEGLKEFSAMPNLPEDVRNYLWITLNRINPAMTQRMILTYQARQNNRSIN